MAYIQKTDYTFRIPIYKLDEILSVAASLSGLTEDEVREDCERWAETRIKSILKSVYDMDAEFAKEATDVPDIRDYQIVKCYIDLALWCLHDTINPRDIPELRELRYQHCIEWLEAVREGDEGLTDVPELPDGGGITFVELVSQRKFVSKPFQDRLIIDEQ